MTPRRHQAELARIADRIAQGDRIDRILVSVTPGGGKSALPGILADRLIPGFADRILWVVPRNALRDQGERDFPSWSRYRIRAAGNELDPCRGTQGYVTTYQAIATAPERHLANVSRGRWIVFLDEPHHVVSGGAWAAALEPVLTCARLVVLASGTFARGDGLPIDGLDYGPDGRPNLDDAPGRAVVRYTRSDALREDATVPVSFRYLDGRTEWEEDGERRSAESFDSDYAPQALFTALRTDYALELLDDCVADWRRYRREVYPRSKLLVVSPTIEQAQVYLGHLARRKLDALIATSDDTPGAHEAIARFKGRALPSVDVLVTVGMAYEGLSVPEVSHIACLTHIRSVPWLEQCFARANRTAPGKTGGFVYGPNDRRYRDAIARIDAEQGEALKDRLETQGCTALSNLEDVPGVARPWITPIGSRAIREGGGELFGEADQAAERPDGGLTPRQAEATLRTQIARHIEVVLAGKRPGSKAALSTIMHKTLKAAVGGKERKDCTVDELAAQWALLKERWPV